jgi:gastric triacylglycerol lipase
MNYAEVAPAFVAARAGYDVWLGNTRGNKYSRKNVKWNPDFNREQFWDFDMTTMGTYDLPAELDFVSQYTGFEKIAYIGHSQGTA